MRSVTDCTILKPVQAGAERAEATSLQSSNHLVAWREEAESSNTAAEVGSSVKIKCDRATVGGPDSAQSSPAENLKSYDNKIKLFPQKATLREHGACSSIYWNPLGCIRETSPTLVTDRSEEADYWAAGETCQKRLQKQKNAFPRKPIATASLTLMRSGGLAVPETQGLSLFPWYSTSGCCTRFLSTVFICLFEAVSGEFSALSPQPFFCHSKQRSLWHLDTKNSFTENCESNTIPVIPDPVS